MATINADYAKFTDRFGLVQPEGNTSDNGLRFTAQFVRALHLAGKLDTLACTEIVEIVKRCEIRPGLFRRAPNNNVQQSHDDYRGLAVISHYCDHSISRRILARGREAPIPYWFDTVDPDEFKAKKIFRKHMHPWLGRFPSMIAMHKKVVGESLSCTHLRWVKGDILKFSLEQDGIVFVWMLRIILGKIKSLEEPFNEWEYNVSMEYPDGVGEVLEEYYNHKHADGTWLKGDFGK